MGPMLFLCRIIFSVLVLAKGQEQFEACIILDNACDDRLSPYQHGLGLDHGETATSMQRSHQMVKWTKVALCTLLPTT